MAAGAGANRRVGACDSAAAEIGGGLFGIGWHLLAGQHQGANARLDRGDDGTALGVPGAGSVGMRGNGGHFVCRDLQGQGDLVFSALATVQLKRDQPGGAVSQGAWLQNGAPPAGQLDPRIARSPTVAEALGEARQERAEVEGAPGSCVHETGEVPTNTLDRPKRVGFGAEGRPTEQGSDPVLDGNRQAARPGISLGDQGGQGGGTHCGGGQQHPSQAGVDRQSCEASAYRCQVRIDCAQVRQERLRACPGRGWRLREPGHGPLAVPGPGLQGQFGQFQALDFRRVGLRAPAVLQRGPQAKAASGRGTARPARALIRRGLAGKDGLQCLEAAGRVEAGLADQAAVHDDLDAGDGDGRLREVGGQHHATPSTEMEGAILLVGGQSTMQGQDVGGTQVGQGLGDTGDLAPAGQEDEHVAIAVRNDPSNGSGHAWHQASVPRQQIGPLVLDLDEMAASGRLQDGTMEERCDGTRIQRGGHGQQPQRGTGLAHLAQQGQGQVGLQAALVQFVEDDRADRAAPALLALQEGIGLQPAGQQPLGQNFQPGLGTDLRLESHAKADLAAQMSAAFRRDSLSHQAGSGPSGLEQQDSLVEGDPIKQRGGRAGGLAGAGRCDEHGGTVLVEGTVQGREGLVDG